MNDDRDPLLDGCLAEVLGGQQPPDLSQRILHAWSQRDAAPADLLSATPVLPPVCDSNADQSPASVQTSVVSTKVRTSKVSVSSERSHRHRNQRYLLWGSVGAAACLAAIVTISLFGRRESDNLAADTAATTQSESTPRTVAAPDQSKKSNSSSSTDRTKPPARPTRRENPATKAPTVVQTTDTPSAPDESKSRTVELPNFATAPAARQVTAVPVPEPLLDDQVVQTIDANIQRHWADKNVKLVSGAEWHHRLFRVVLGRDPTATEVAEYKSDTPAARAQLITRLTTGDEYLEEYARHWSDLLTDAFLPADLAESSPMAHRDGLQQYFRRAVVDGRGFDQIAIELLTAKGSGRPGDPEYNGAANFLLARAAGKFEHATADTARLFLGHDISCQQCHNHPADRARGQQEFWELNAFFRQLAAVPSDDNQAARVINRDFMGDDRQDGRSAIVFYEQPDGVLKGAFPAFRGQADLPKSGLVDELDRRRLLAECVVHAPEFRRTAINRVWEAMFGSELASVQLPADAHPHRQLLEQLGDQFAAHRFDLRRAIAWAALSAPFAAPPADSLALHSWSEFPKFDRFAEPVRGSQLPVRQSLLAAVENWGSQAANATTTARLQDTSTIVKGTSGGNVPKPSVLDSTSGMQLDPIAQRIVDHPTLTNRQKAEHLFQLAVHRQPRGREMETIERLLELGKQNPAEAWRSVWQALHPAVLPNKENP